MNDVEILIDRYQQRIESLIPRLRQNKIKTKTE